MWSSPSRSESKRLLIHRLSAAATIIAWSQQAVCCSCGSYSVAIVDVDVDVDAVLCFLFKHHFRASNVFLLERPFRLDAWSNTHQRRSIVDRHT